MDLALQLQPGQVHLTREQEAEVKRFTKERLAAQLSIEPVDEAQAEAWLREAYRVAGLAPPKEIIWLDGPIALVLLLGPLRMWEHQRAGVEASVRESLRASMVDSMRQVRVNVWSSVVERLWESLEASVRESMSWFSSWGNGRNTAWDSMRASVWNSVRAYADALWLTIAHFFAVYLAPNELSVLARFNELVSGYWLGTDRALLVRKPRALGQDAVGRWHSASGKCRERYNPAHQP